MGQLIKRGPVGSPNQWCGSLDCLAVGGQVGVELAGFDDDAGLCAALRAMLASGTQARCEFDFTQNAIIPASGREIPLPELVASHRGSVPKLTRQLEENVLMGSAAFTFPALHHKSQILRERRGPHMDGQRHPRRERRELRLRHQGLQQAVTLDRVICWQQNSQISGCSITQRLNNAI